MALIDEIINQGESIIQELRSIELIELRLYGSVLARLENEHSDIDLLAVFHALRPFSYMDAEKIKEVMERRFNRRISVVDSRRIPELFKPSILTDPIDIRKLRQNEHYSITPKSSLLYYKTIQNLLNEEAEQYIKMKDESAVWKKFAEEICESTDRQHNDLEKRVRIEQRLYKYYYSDMVEKMTYWFSRLLRLKDNDLTTQTFFDWIDIIRLQFELDIEPRSTEKGMSTERLIQRFRKELPGIAKWIISEGLSMDE